MFLSIWPFSKFKLFQVKQIYLRSIVLFLNCSETLTAFVKGSSHEFDTGIVTDSSVLPGASAQFELIIPGAFGYFIGYSYSLNWEEF